MLKAHAQPIPPPGPLRDIAMMNYEWKGWQDVVFEFKSLGIDVNDARYNPVVKAIQLWGEKLHRLRAEQEPRIVEKALLDYERQYSEVASPS